MKEINIGKMNKKIYICTPRTIQDEMGQKKEKGYGQP